eukprot:6181276-Pleurochrysis_carterae.AAC.2
MPTARSAYACTQACTNRTGRESSPYIGERSYGPAFLAEARKANAHFNFSHKAALQGMQLLA